MRRCVLCIWIAWDDALIVPSRRRRYKTKQNVKKMIQRLQKKLFGFKISKVYFIILMMMVMFMNHKILLKIKLTQI